MRVEENCAMAETAPKTHNLLNEGIRTKAVIRMNFMY